MHPMLGRRKHGRIDRAIERANCSLTHARTHARTPDVLRMRRRPGFRLAGRPPQMAWQKIFARHAKQMQSEFSMRLGERKEKTNVALE